MGWVDVATVIEEVATHQIIELELKWKSRGVQSGLEGEGLKGGEEGKNNNNSQGLGIDRAIRKSI